MNEQSEQRAISPSMWMCVLLWPLLVGMAVIWYVRGDTQARVDAAMQTRPQIAVLDIDGIVRNRGANVTVEQALSESNAIAMKLRGAGFLVLRSSYVIGAPPAIMVPQPEGPEK